LRLIVEELSRKLIKKEAVSEITETVFFDSFDKNFKSFHKYSSVLFPQNTKSEK